MTPQEQQEGNRVIAEYYGEKHNARSELAIYINVSPDYPNTPFEIHGMYFHNSHDWLQPVAKRVKEELDNVISGNNLPDKQKAIDLIGILEWAGSEFDISQLFPAVVRAIEFLNSLKEKPNCNHDSGELFDDGKWRCGWCNEVIE